MLELQRELDEQEERDKDFIMLQRLAEEEVRTNTFDPKATHTEETSLSCETVHKSLIALITCLDYKLDF